MDFRARAVLLVAASLGAACSSHGLPPLPARPDGATVGVVPPPVDPPGDAARGGPAAPAAGPVGELPPRPHPNGAPVAAPAAGGIDATRDGDALLPGVLVRGPAVVEGEARFRVENGSGVDLSDLILTVHFVLAGAGPEEGRTWIETVEAPLRAGESRDLRVRPSRPGTLPPERFRVDAGRPDILAVGDGVGRGTTFVGGRLECVELDLDLTAVEPHAAVGLAPVAGTDALPPLEAQLLLARAGRLVWAGAWIRLPEAAGDGDGVRRVRWNLRVAPGVAGTTPYLRVRERR